MANIRISGTVTKDQAKALAECVLLLSGDKDAEKVPRISDILGDAINAYLETLKKRKAR